MGYSGRTGSKFAKTLVGDQEQRRVRQRRSIPLRAVVRRQQWRCTGDPVPPLIFLPALRKFAAEQKRLGQLEVRTRCRRVNRQSAAGAGDALIELQFTIMGDRQIVQRLEIVGIPLERLIPDTQCVVVTPEPLKDGTEVAAKPNRVRGQTDRTLDHFRCRLVAPHPEEQHPLLVQRPGFIRRGRQNVVQDSSASGSRPFSENSPAIFSSSSSGTATFGIAGCPATGDDDAITPA